MTAPASVRTVRPARVLLVCLLLAFLEAAPARAQGQESGLSVHLNRGYEALRADSLEAAIEAFERAVAAEPDSVRPHLELAYALLAAERFAAAAERFEAALAIEPDRPAVHKQLGYVYLRLERPRPAVEHFLAVRRLTPEDDYQVALQLGYVYQQLGEPGASRRAFAEAAEAPDPEIAAQARQAIENLGAGAPGPGSWPADVYAAPMYQARFGNVIVPLIVRAGPLLTARPSLQAYGLLRATRDTRSVGGASPEFYSDNVAVVGAGLRMRVSPYGPTLYAEAGPAFALVERDEAVRLDVRSGVYGSHTWGAYTLGPAESRFPMTWVGDLYYDASYYTRFENAIAYLQARPGLRVLDTDALGAVDAYAALQAVADTRRRYFNNVVELGAGLRWHPPGMQGLSLRATYLRGWYTVTDGAPTDRYSDLRVMLVLSHYWRLFE